MTELIATADDAEKSTIGAMILEYEAIALAQEVVTAADFYRNRNREIFETILDMDMRGCHIDIVTVYEELRRLGKADETTFSYVMALREECAGGMAVRSYARFVADAAASRRNVAAAEEMSEMSFFIAPGCDLARALCGWI